MNPKMWKGSIHLDYFRDGVAEVDFVVHVGHAAYLPVEVKYRRTLEASDFNGVRAFARRHRKGWPPVIVTRRWEDFGPRTDGFLIPLPLFLLLFD